MWVLFASSPSTCCLVDGGYMFILVSGSVYENALEKLKTKFGLHCPHGKLFQYYAHTGETEDKAWEDYFSYNRIKVNPTSWRTHVSKKSLFIFDEQVEKNLYSVIMPNGTDGMICNTCKNFWPYVTPNLNNQFICANCRFNFVVKR